MALRRSIGLTVALLSLAACGSDGRVAQPEDDFLDQVEAECRTAERALDKLDFATLEADVVDQAVDVLSTAVDALRELEAPQSLAKDFDNFVGSIDDQVSEGGKLSSSLDAGDTAGADASVTAIGDLSTDADKAADSLGALQCKGLTPDDELVTSPIDTVPIDTTPVDTTPIDTVPIDTVPIDTTPIDTTPIDTTPTTDGTEVYPDDLDLIAVAPTGYEWVADYQQIDATGLFAKSVLGPLVTSYAAGQVVNLSDESTASFYVVRISAEWTPEAVEQYLFWEGVEEGTDEVTPAGYPVKVELLAFTNTDCLAYYAGTVGISVCTYTGIDPKPVLDAYIAANPG